MVSKKQVSETVSLSHLSEWITKELNAQVDTIQHLSDQVDALQDLVDPISSDEKLRLTEQGKTWLPDACSFDVTCLPPRVPNLYACEFTSDNLPYRWTGPDRTTQLNFNINRTNDKHLEIKFLGAASPEVLKVVKLYVDRREAPVILTESSLTATLPAKHNAPHVTEIILTLAQTISPNSLNGSKDTRLLGISISGVSIK